MLKITKIEQNTKLVCKNKIKWHRMGFKKNIDWEWNFQDWEWDFEEKIDWEIGLDPPPLQDPPLTPKYMLS